MTRQLSLRLSLESHARLDDFVGTAAAGLRRLDGAILVLGSSGTGKSHLLQGLCRERLDQGDRVIYLGSLERLSPRVLDDLEQAALVCLDDIDRVLDAAAWQLALFHLMNACRDRQATLVMSARDDESLFTLPLADLVSRLRAAYRLPLAPLGDEDKLEVVRRKARQRGFEMSEEVCRFILSRAPRDMHHLARLVEQLDEETLRRQKKVTIPFVKQALGL